ncbi:hypothetical protein [Pusillimonas minor]|uniref:Uncharacterized protein n=1 Tax=Pusillimonas minor TaxID=2697024 RepID=A0A842HMM2_9BURK|nr:hypothetical protein [Pusillimonas minor]MBC2769496.1 hypothetical protein [Pusillimonas minor]
MDTKFFTQNARDVLLEVEVNPEQADKFEGDYFNATNIRPVAGPHYQQQPNKWGAEYRIYFNCDIDLTDEFENLKIHVEKAERLYREEWECRVNNKEFFWALIDVGYRLGKN